jgi:hypothetical protein
MAIDQRRGGEFAEETVFLNSDAPKLEHLP